ncbi:hypothetical protein [Methylomagnum sp.]
MIQDVIARHGSTESNTAKLAACCCRDEALAVYACILAMDALGLFIAFSDGKQPDGLFPGQLN